MFIIRLKWNLRKTTYISLRRVPNSAAVSFPKSELGQTIIYDYISVTLGDRRPSYSTVRNWAARFRIGHSRTVDEEHYGISTEVTVPENVDGIHCVTLVERRISADICRDPANIPREDTSHYPRDCRHEKALSKMSWHMPQWWVEVWWGAFFTSLFGPIWAGCCGISFNRPLTIDETLTMYLHILSRD
jgi:hypothetical protein